MHLQSLLIRSIGLWSYSLVLALGICSCWHITWAGSPKCTNLATLHHVIPFAACFPSQCRQKASDHATQAIITLRNQHLPARRVAMATSVSQSRCFLDSRNLYKDAAISLEEHLRDYVSHLSGAERHEDCRNLSSASVTSLTAHDVVEGAITAVMLDEDAVVSAGKYFHDVSSADPGNHEV